MSQFGGGKPPGQWGRPAPPGGAQLPGFPAVNVGAFPMVGMGVPMGMVNQAAFSSPSVLGMQGIMGAVPQQALGQQPSAANGLQQSATAKNQRTFVGVVTKMLDTYGFVDDDVFFQHSVIRGSHPRVGDKVMVEASYNPNMPFKWNAYRIQLLNAASQSQPEPNRMQQQHASMNRSNESTRWSSNTSASDRNGRDSPRDRRNDNTTRRHSPRRSPPRRNISPKRDPPPRARDVRRSPPRRSPPPRRPSPPSKSDERRNDRKRERSPSGSVAPSVRRDSASPPRRRARIIPRYECKIQKPVLLSEVISGSILRHRYSKLYLPSDYVDLSFDWVRTVQLDMSLDLNNPIQFHVFNKDVDVPLLDGESLPEFEPEDADHRYQVKVLLLAHAGKSEIAKKSFCLLPDGSTDDHQEPQSIYKNLSFLVGVRGKETMAIGGSWSPSLDGGDPTSLATMIRTAVRTTKSLTGIDLSSVSQWFSMVQVRYYRADKQRVDHVNILLPDTQQLMPDDSAWTCAEQKIADQLKIKLESIEAMKIEEEEEEEEESVATEIKPEATAEAETESENKEAENVKDEEEKMDVSMTSESGEADSKDEADQGNTEEQLSGPTNWSKLDPKSMKVAELRTELLNRGLETKGIKTLLVQRLQTALDQEKAASVSKESKDVEMKDADATEVKKEQTEENPAAFIAPPAEETKAKIEAEAKKAQEKAEARKKKEEALEKEKKEKKELLEKHYQFPKEKRVLVYPSKAFKSGKFDCKIITLSSLLDYRSDDNKENQFEVSLFAEAFREMVERHSAFTIYDTLVNCGDRETEKKRREEAREKPIEPPKEEKKEEPATEAAAETTAETTSPENKEKTEKVEKVESPKTEKIELKSVVANRTVYEAFSYFDVNLCGYITERDIEEILYNGEFGISRGQIQKLAKKLSVRDRINYRHLTDVLTDMDGNVRYTPGGADDVIETDDLITGYGYRLAKNSSTNSTSQESNSKSEVSSDGIVVLNGSVVNVPQKLKLLKQVEQERDAAKSQLNEHTSLIDQLRETKSEMEKKKKDIESHYHKANKKLNETTAQLKSVQDDYSALKQALVDCKRHADRIFGVVEKALPPPPKKEDSKSSKDKEKTSDKSSEKEEKSSEPQKEQLENGEEGVAEIVLAEEVGEEEEKKETTTKDEKTNVEETVEKKD